MSQYSLQPEKSADKKRRVAAANRRRAEEGEDYDPAAEEAPRSQHVPVRPIGELSATDLRNQPMRERIAAIPRGLVSGLGGSMTYANRVGEDIAGAADFIPVLGDALGAAETVEAAKQGNWWDAGINAASTGLGAVPIAGDAAAKGLKKLVGQGTGKWDIVPDDPNQMSVYLGKQKDPEQWHKAGGGGKMDQPFSELTYKTEPTGGTPLPPQKTYTPEEMQGSVGVALLGDKTRSGETLTQVNGIDLTNPQKLEGGYRYGDEFPGEIWASDAGAMRKILEKAELASEGGKKRVLGLPVAQGAEGGDFARMMTGPTLDLMRQAELTPEAKQFLDAALTKELMNAKTGKTRWPGIDNVLKNDDWMNSASGNDRAQLAKAMTLKTTKTDRVPIAALRKALTAPDLLNRPALTTGLNVGEFDLGKGMVTGGKRHGTYPVGAAGTSLGRVGVLPYDWMFQKHAAESLPGKDLAQAQRTVMTQIPVQDFNQEWLDNLMARRARLEGQGR